MWRHGERVHQDFKKHTITRSQRRSQAQMAARVDKEPKSFGKQNIVSHIPSYIKSKIKLTPKISSVLTGHEMTKAYLHRFHLREEATCTCGNEYQTMDHIMFQCTNNSAQREVLKQQNLEPGQEARKSS